MSLAMNDTKNLFARTDACSYVLDNDGVGGLRNPGAFLQGVVAEHGLACFATIPEVLNADLAGILNVDPSDQVFQKELLIHRAELESGIGHVVEQTPRLISVQTTLLGSAKVAKLLSDTPNWRTRALVAAVAIEYGLTILGASRFYPTLARYRRIPAGVRHPKTGEWTVSPTL